MDKNAQNAQAQEIENENIADLAAGDATFTNNRLYSRIRWYDYLFLGVSFLIFVALATLFFLIAFFLHAPDSYLAYAIIIFFWVVFAVLGMIKRDNKRTWIYVYKFLRFQSQSKKITPEKLQNDFFIKSIARLANPADEITGKHEMNDSDECNIFFYGHRTNNKISECAIALKVDIDGIESYTQLSDLYNKLNAMNDFLTGLNTINKKRDLTFDLVFWNSQKQDTSTQITQLEKAEKTKHDLASILLIEEKKAFYRDVNEFLKPENQPSFFNYYNQPINLKNHYFVYVIKGSDYNDAVNNAREFTQRFSIIGQLKPLTWADTKSMFGVYFRGINFEEEKPVNSVPVTLMSDDITATETYWIYNITNDTTNNEIYTNSALDYITKIDVEQTHLTLNFANGTKLYVAVRGFVDLPDRFNLGWMLPFEDANIGVMITQKFAVERYKSFNRRQLKIMRENNEKWQRDELKSRSNPYFGDQLSTSINDSVNFAHQLTSKQITMLNYRYYIVLHATDKQQLVSLTAEFDNLLNQELKMGAEKKEHYTFDQYACFVSAFPSASDLLRRRRYDQNYISSLAITQGWPFMKNTTFLKEGTFIGMQVDSDNLAIVNDVTQGLSPSYHTGIFASTGSGKTELMKHIAIDYCTYKKPVKVIAVDPNADYEMMVKNLGGQVYHTDPNKLNVNPILESNLIKAKPDLMGNYADQLIKYTINSRHVVQKQELVMRGPGMWWTITDTEITPDIFEQSLEQQIHIPELTKQKMKALYAHIYLACVSKMVINPFHIIDLIGPTYDLLLRVTRWPSAFEVYNTFVSSLTNFFTQLISNINHDQLSLISSAIKLMYQNVCQINVAIDPYTKESYLTRDGTKKNRINYDDLLHLKNYPVFNDFYEWFEVAYKEAMKKPDTHSEIKLQYERLNSILKDFAYFDTGYETYKGSFSDYWNTDAEAIKIDADYTCFITDNISNGLKTPQDTSGLPSVNEYTIARAQMFLLWSIIKARVARNGQEKYEKSTEEQPFIRVIIDEAHTVIKDYQIRQFILSAVKEWRKWNAGLTMITQNLTDILHLPNGDGEGIMEQLANKYILGTTMRGLNAYIDYLAPFPVFKQTQDWLTNPKGLSQTVLHEDENPHPPGYGIAVLKNNDQSQVRIKFGYTEFPGMICGNNDYQGGVPLNKLVSDILNGRWPISSHDKKDHPRPVPPLIRGIVVDADRRYNEQLNNKEIQTTMQLKVQAENSVLEAANLPQLDLETLTNYGGYNG